MTYVFQQQAGRELLETIVKSLVSADWENPKGPLVLNENLHFADVANADFLINTRIFLAAVHEQGGAPLTATGNLNRKFVAGLFDRLKLSNEYRESIQSVCKVVNEQDLWALHMVRVISECAGLIARRGKRFQVTKLGRTLLPEAQAGALFRKIFVTYFRKFDLRYDFHLRDVPSIQQTMAVILWRLDSVAQDWKKVEGLAPAILLPGVIEEMHRVMVGDFETEEWIMKGYVLEPLLDLGILECKRLEQKYFKKISELRVTELWRKFIRFSWDRDELLPGLPIAFGNN